MNPSVRAKDLGDLQDKGTGSTSGTQGSHESMSSSEKYGNIDRIRVVREARKHETQ